MTPEHVQRQAFLDGEADRYFERNPLDFAASLADPWNRHLASLVPAGGRVLEIGCSDGRRLAAIGELAGHPVTALCGVDPSQTAIGRGVQQWPHLDIRVATADNLPFTNPFDLVLFGFCLYVCDRSLLFRVAHEADRLTATPGWLAIIDFDPLFPSRRGYRHLADTWSWKMDYANLFQSNPSYQLAHKLAGNHQNPSWTDEPSERTALWTLRKLSEHAYTDERDQ